MPTKYAKERLLRAAPRPPFLRQRVTPRISARARLNLVVIIICMMVFALQAVGPFSQRRPEARSLAAAVIESKEQTPREDGQAAYALRLRLLDTEGHGTLLDTAVSEAVWRRFATGDKVAVVYAPASGLAPARVFEIGAVPLEGASATDE